MNIDTPDLARTMLLIDGSHVDRLKTKLGRLIDFQKLISHFSADGVSVSAHYYRDSRDSAEQARMTRFFDWLERHAITRHGVDDFNEPWYVRERYGTNLVALASDAIIAADEADRIVVLAGDAKLVPLLERLAKMDVTVTLISSLSVPQSIAPPPPLVELADEFIDLANDVRFFMPEDGHEDMPHEPPRLGGVDRRIG
ncbi:NYN domain-containing protein [Paracoccus liaowanqingii]|uniref:NYN domain-containing protein n=1 Tax=Paracoccus liaowanqingii TaxID=2560053 RepID=A0A4Z1CSB8_9RHOB|nr:NYN domain-containing protein [Paracoccus liaowanqingii]QDA36300.1 NYN domain-containing protein [Paracoccus liaowanqingii]TGN68172.1 NYN domain-containing protein [Paracoccus liaowanqingii]